MKNFLNPAAFALFAAMALQPAFAVDYPVMQRTFTNNAGQQNRYIKKVTTDVASTPVVFECTSETDLPYTPFSSAPNAYTTSGANIDKTANPIVIEAGTSAFNITYFGWNDAIAGNKSEMNWTQEACFVDWNGDGKFEGSDEIYPKGWSSVPYDAIFTGATRTITVPANQPAGDYRLRVVFFEPADNSTLWQNSLFTTLDGKIRNGISYDMTIRVNAPGPMEFKSAEFTTRQGRADLSAKDVEIATYAITTSGVLNPMKATRIRLEYTGDDPADITNLRLMAGNTVVASAKPSKNIGMALDYELIPGINNLKVVADVAENATLGNQVSFAMHDARVNGSMVTFSQNTDGRITIVSEPDYTAGNAIWFDTPNSSTQGVAIWNTNDFSTSATNPDQIWERKSFPIGNGSFGGNIIGGVSRERVTLNEKTLWKGGPGSGVSQYWDMNRNVSESTLSTIRQYLENNNSSAANSLVTQNYSGKINYDRNRFGVFTIMGEAYVSTGLDESGISNYKRILNIDRSLAVVQFMKGDAFYSRRYFVSYPDNVMVWNYSSEGATQDLTFSFATPQNVTSTTLTADGKGLLIKGKLDNNSMEWALRVDIRVNGAGTVKANASDRTISVTGATDVDFILAGDTDYRMNFTPDITDPRAFVGEDPVANVNEWVDAASKMSFDALYSRHYDDYQQLYGRTTLAINPSKNFDNIPTPNRLANYRNGTLDNGLEQIYFQYGRYLLISSSRPGTMPANLQGLWHNNSDGPWRVDYHNNINLQMNYWPATSTNLLECFTPFIDYVRGLVEPGARTAQAYYGARGWTAEVSTNIFGFTAPLNSSDMSWNYNPTAGPWLASQIWEYYDYTRDDKWLREVGYDIIKQSADFCSDLLYFTNGSYTSAPSYSPEHGTADLGATYANAVTREVLMAAIKAANILDVDPESVREWSEKLENIYPYQVGQYGQLQEWYRDIDTYNDTHRHTNHLFGLHPGTSINPLTDQSLVDACKETLRQRGDAATGWSMGWKLNHWARLLDGDHAYILFQNLLKEGTADNLWDLHPPFQIDGNFGGTAGVAELLLQSHNGCIHLLPALPSQWTEGSVSGLLTRGNFEVSIDFADHTLQRAAIHSNVGGKCNVRYGNQTVELDTEAGGDYTVTYDAATDRLTAETYSSADNIKAPGADTRFNVLSAGKGSLNVQLSSPACELINIEIHSLTGQLIKAVKVNKTETNITVPVNCNLAAGCYIVSVSGPTLSAARKVTVR